jgi:hypothetical protein
MALSVDREGRCAMSMTAGATRVIKRKSDLAALSRAIGVLGAPQVGKLSFELDGTKRAQQLAWERRLNAYLARCGCTTGAVVTLATLAGGVFLVIRNAAEAPLLELVLWLAAAAIAASLLGLAAKLVVLTVTGMQLRATLRGILRVLEIIELLGSELLGSGVFSAGPFPVSRQVVEK